MMKAKISGLNTYSQLNFANPNIFRTPVITVNATAIFSRRLKIDFMG
jgi:hypothetical protein